ncbi:MAG TPA: sigma factor, partial [Streptosporangiaceae bacterium]
MAISRGDETDAWLGPYRAPLIGFVLPLVNGDLAAAEDVVQETMFRARQHSTELEPERTGSWLHAVARNIAISACYRGPRGRPWELPLDESTLPPTDDGVDWISDAWPAVSSRENKEDENMSAVPRWNVITPRPRPMPASGPRADPAQNPARVLSAIALASIAAGAINIAAAATVGRASAQTLAFFAVVAAAQLAWGAVALVRAPRWWLALGAAGDLIAVATWVVSRTVGLPAGVYAGVKLPVGFADALATALEVVIVIGAAALMARGRGPAWSAARSPRVIVAATVVAGALAVVGVLAQAGAIGSSPASSGPAGVT